MTIYVLESCILNTFYYVAVADTNILFSSTDIEVFLNNILKGKEGVIKSYGDNTKTFEQNLVDDFHSKIVNTFTKEEFINKYIEEIL